MTSNGCPSSNGKPRIEAAPTVVVPGATPVNTAVALPESLVVPIAGLAVTTPCGTPPKSKVAPGTGLQNWSAAKATTSAVSPTANVDFDTDVHEPGWPLAQVRGPATTGPALNGTGGVATPSALATDWPFHATEETTGEDDATVEVSVTAYLPSPASVGADTTTSGEDTATANDDGTNPGSGLPKPSLAVNVNVYAWTPSATTQLARDGSSAFATGDST